MGKVFWLKEKRLKFCEGENILKNYKKQKISNV